MKHIRNERATREAYGLVGSSLELDAYRETRNLCRAWCGVDASGAFFYRSADHAAASAATGVRDACPDCVNALVTHLLLAAGISGPVTFEVRG